RAHPGDERARARQLERTIVQCVAGDAVGDQDGRTHPVHIRLPSMIATSTPKPVTLPPPRHGREHWARVRDEVARTSEEVPLYAGRAAPPASADPEAIAAWLASLPTIAKRDLRRGFPKSMVRKSCDLKDAMQKGLVEIIATSGTTENRLQVLWE